MSNDELVETIGYAHKKGAIYASIILPIKYDLIINRENNIKV